jgi:hypothetical protein
MCPICNKDLANNNDLNFQTITYKEKSNLLKMQQFRIIVPNLLYVIGLPR